jgi:hypothetical protein
MRCLPSSICFVAMSQFIGPSLKKELKLQKLPKPEASTLRYKVPHLWPQIEDSISSAFAKAYGIKVRCY